MSGLNGNGYKPKAELERFLDEVEQKFSALTPAKQQKALAILREAFGRGAPSRVKPSQRAQ